jgi:hypothetical protein
VALFAVLLVILMLLSMRVEIWSEQRAKGLRTASHMNTNRIYPRLTSTAMVAPAVLPQPRHQPMGISRNDGRWDRRPHSKGTAQASTVPGAGRFSERRQRYAVSDCGPKRPSFA